MSDITINVLMTGGLRCGKTSVLAAMQGCLESLVGTTGLTISPANPHNLDKLEEKFQESLDIFRNRKKFAKGFYPDDNPSQDIQQYDFRVFMYGQKTDILIRFWDYPGEFIRDHVHNNEIRKIFALSRIIIIAIDTPHMMEEEQRFDDRRNLERRIFENFKASEFLAPGRGPALVLFVPLKCEKYYNERRLEEVAKQVGQSYNHLVTYLRETARQNNIQLSIGITPILTLGGVAFSHFERDADGEIKITAKNKLPERPLYIFPDLSKAAPEPKYCEQPLLQILRFSINSAIQNKKKFLKPSWLLYCTLVGLCGFILGRSIFWGIVVFFLMMYFLNKRASKKQKELVNLESQIQALSGQIKTGGDGYAQLR